jgi:hypothetical protein
VLNPRQIPSVCFDSGDLLRCQGVNSDPAGDPDPA